MSVDDPAGLDPPGVTPGHSLEVAPCFPPEVTLGLGSGGGGGGGSLSGVSLSLSVDDPAGLAPPGVTPGHSPGVTPGFPPEVTLGLGSGGGGGGGYFVSPSTFADLLLMPEGEVPGGAFLSVPILESSCGHSERGGRGGAGMLKHAKCTGGRLAISKIACG